ncbi:MAG TPA: sigma-54 dependent transcriptional regulator [Flavihumibacter sp.]|nr:sigma-54 dependent transcriptional regulator [Bacteroidota bacterium]HOA36938.1 sigma-54 dependent transcriptional regulator [Flavihumibacter sp.]HPZ86849.1 sigma-54 dependent transcriptional regulator [Flavihumibacter sp.]HQD08153.1 sigma-54 dependent transcriptional regulator [Flavihumibacter sp.]
MKKILVIDDDFDVCFLIQKFLTNRGYAVDTANGPRNALSALDKADYDLVITDFRMEGMDGNTLMQQIKEKRNIPVVIISAYKDIKTAVESIKLGAHDFILKPVLPQELAQVVADALVNNQHPVVKVMNGSSTGNQPPYEKASASIYIVGNSEVFKPITQQIKLVGPTSYNVIIYGESGTGKEAIAHQIHAASKRTDGPFVAIDCGALSRDLAGSELFGHVKGSFTGAINNKTGSFELANNGTIFLDEVANLPYSVQVSLLRVLQERKIRPIGADKDIDINVRIIVASNEKLWNKCKTGAFREDLYHRFNEFSIELPALRQRADDIPLFCAHFLQLANQQLNKNIEGFTDECMEVLLHYSWPGNLRELQNTVKRAALLTEGNRIELKSIPFEIVYANQVQFDAKPAIEGKRVEQPPGHFTSLKASSIDYEYELIQKTLRENNFNKSKTARVLNIDRKTLYNKIAIYEELLTKKQRAHD